MMAFRIATQPTATIAKARPVKRDAYREFVSSLPCVITRLPGVQVAHLSWARPEIGHFGRGMSQKASDRWVLPLTPPLHDQQHAMGDEQAFWKMQAPDPHLACMILWGLWSDYGDDAHEHAVKIILGGIAS